MIACLRVGACLVLLIATSGVLAFAQTPAAPPPAATSPPAGQPPAPAGGDQTVKVYMPDGQLKSHSIRVYVTREIQPSQKPRLRLLRSHAVTKQAVDAAVTHEPGVVAPNQEWVQSIDGQDIRKTGTLLMFDLSNVPFGYKAMQRVTPVVSWTDGGGERIAVGADEVNVGNLVAALCWTVIVVGLTLLVIFLLSTRRGGTPLELLTGVDGHLSLAQTQVACWTVVIGGVVLGYGMIKLEIPTIPESLIVLMGASLATGGIAFFQDAKKQQAAGTAGQRPMAMSDLIRVFPPGQPPELSLAKAQMLFWTVLLLVLFVSKSILDGAIWAVPWALVALMGFSQAGYLAPKIADQPTTTPTPTTTTTTTTTPTTTTSTGGGS